MKNKAIHRNILKIAFPSILSNITVPLLSLIDMTITGHLGEAYYIGAIAVGGTIFNMIYWVFAFLRMGTTGITSQQCGAGDLVAVRGTLYRSLLTSISISLLIILLQWPIVHVAMGIMKPPSVEVAHYTGVYFSTCVWGAPAVLALYSLTGWFIGMQNARYPLYVALIQNITNIVASLFLVFVCDLSVRGVALGTVIAQYAGLLFALWCCASMHKKLGIKCEISWPALLHRAALSRFFKVNRDIFLRTLCLVSVTMFFTSAGARSGTEVLAANALLMQFFTFFSYFMDGFAFAGEALSGKCAGQGDEQGLSHTITSLFQWAVGVAVLFTAVYALWGDAILTLLTNNEPVIAVAHTYLPRVLCIPFLSLSAFVWDGVFIGITATRGMLISMFVAMLLFFTCYYLLGRFMASNESLWLAFLIYLSTRGMVQHMIYRFGIRSSLPSSPLE